MVTAQTNVAQQSDPVVVQLLSELNAARSLHAYMDMTSIMAARYMVGQHWKSGIGAQAGVVIPPKVTAKKPLVTANMIAALVRQWDGRLMVGDFSAWFEPKDARPESHITARQQQSYYNYFIKENNPQGWHNDLSFFRIVCGTAIGTWYFDEDRPGGIGLAVLHPGRLTIDPANRAWDLDDHEYVIQSDALSCDEARRRYGRYFDDDRPFMSDCRLSQLRSVDSYVGSALYNLQPGGGDSISNGVIVYRRFFKNFKRMQIIIQNPSPTYKDKKNGKAVVPEFFVATPPEGNGNGDRSWRWRWGNPYLKLDMFKNIAMSFANGLVVGLVPMQNLVNIALKTGLGAFISRAGWMWMAHKGTVENPAALQNGRVGSTVWLTSKAFKENMMPQPVSPPRFDTNADALYRQSNDIMAMLSHVTPTLQGETVSRGQAYSAYELNRRQALVPLEAVATIDQTRTQRFFNRMTRAALDHYGRTKPGYLADIVGRSFGSSFSSGIAAKHILKGPTTCVLRRSAFLAQTAQEKEARVMALAQAGRIDPLDLPHELYQMTGYPVMAGQEEAYQHAYELVYRILNNEADSDPMLDDDLDVIKRVIETTMRLRLKMELTREQLGRLGEAKTRVLLLMAQRQAEEAAVSGMGQAMVPQDQPQAAGELAGPPPQDGGMPAGEVAPAEIQMAMQG